MSLPETAPFKPGLEPAPYDWARPNFYVHPDHPGLLIRHHQEASSGFDLEQDGYVFYWHAAVREGLQQLDQVHGIPNAGFDVLTVPPDVYIVTHIIADGVNLETLAINGMVNADAAEEIDKAYCGLVDYTNNLIENGGYYIYDTIDPSQMVYSPSAPKGRRVILVDTNADGPNYTERLSSPALRENYTAQLLNQMVAYLVDAVTTFRSLGAVMPQAESKIRSLLNTYPTPTDKLQRAVKMLKNSLNKGDPLLVSRLLDSAWWDRYLTPLILDDAQDKWRQLKGDVA